MAQQLHVHWVGPPELGIEAGRGQAVEWSDWDGKPAYDPLVTAAFTKATQNVQAIGLSFGGTYFFETGVTADYSGTPPPYEFFSSQFSEN